MTRALGGLLCIVLWSYPLGESVFAGSGRQVEQELRIVVCERKGEQFLEVHRITRFAGYEELTSDKAELVLPWGASGRTGP